MYRRNFLTVAGAAVLAPLVPAQALPTLGYSRTQYGLAVFHARTRASLSAADLMRRLNVSGAAADAMIAEMKTSGVIAPITNVAAGVMRAVSQNRATPAKLAGEVTEKAIGLAKDALLEDATNTIKETEIQYASEMKQEENHAKI